MPRCALGAAALTVAAATAAVAPAAHAAVDLDLLFVGNSYTYQVVGYDGSLSGDNTYADRNFDDLRVSPFEAIVGAYGASLASSQNVAIPGRKLSQHAGFDGPTQTDRQTLLYLNNFELLDPTDPQGHDFDVIVLQELSSLPGTAIKKSSNNSDFIDFFNEGLETIVNQIKSKNPDARIVLYNTWARETDALAQASGFTSRADMAQKTNDAYAIAQQYITAPTNSNVVVNPNATLQGLGYGGPVDIAPAGQAFEAWIADAWYANNLAGTFGNALDLIYDNDGNGDPDNVSHPAIAGEFLAASVLFESIYGVSTLSLIQQGLLTQQSLNSLFTQNDVGGYSGTTSLNLQLATYLAGLSGRTTGIPEPATLGIAALGLAALGRRRRAA